MATLCFTISVKSKLIEEIQKLNVEETGLKMMRFKLRETAMEDFQKTLAEICPDNFIDKSTIPEYTFYTQMGRGDLVLFKSWREKFARLNNLPENTLVPGI